MPEDKKGPPFVGNLDRPAGFAAAVGLPKTASTKAQLQIKPQPLPAVRTLSGSRHGLLGLPVEHDVYTIGNL
jgi:hypothetical protein